MDDIISRLSEIEDSSQSYIDDAILKKKEIAAEMNAKKELWKQDLDAKTKSRIAALQESMNVAKEKKILELKQQSEKAFRDLQDMYDTNHDKYVDTLFSEMINEYPWEIYLNTLPLLQRFVQCQVI